MGDTELNWLHAICLAWERGRAEAFFDRWEVLSIEEELQTPITSNVVLYTRADAVLRDRADGTLWVLNWKTAGDVKGWNRKWFYDIQSWTESLAAESKLGEPVAGCIYIGVHKGPMYNGQISSRLLYGYRYKGRDGESFSYATENNGGGVRFSVAQEKFPFGDGIPAWVNFLSPEYLSGFFVESAPQIRQDRLVEAWLRQVAAHESDIDHILQEGSVEDRSDFFWQNWSDGCGRCPYNALCLEKTNPEELIKDGLMKPRGFSPRDEMEKRLNDRVS